VFYPFSIIAAVAGRKQQAQPAFSLKEAAWMLAAGAVTFAVLALVFWLAARSVLL
jgi:hypothetical protein